MPTISELSGISISSFKFIDGIDIANIESIDGVDLVTATLLLDTTYGSGAEAAYSVRKLRTAYKGAAIQVQRSVGVFPTQEIGFDVNGNLDTATLLTYASGNEVRVSVWYDQSLNLNNAVQTTVAQRPIVVAAGGALVEIDGRAAMNLDGGTDGFDITSNIQGAYSIFTIGNPSANDRYYQDSSFGSRQFIIRNSSVAGSFSKYQNGTGTTYLYGFTKELVEFISNAPTILYTNTLLMRYTNTGAYLGDFSEYIIYTSAKSGTNQTSIQENIGDYYTQNQAPYLLDTYTGAAAAYSLRKLRTDYTGFAIKVQDSVGSPTQDIGFDVFGELDTVSLLKYAKSNDVFVETFYDQSGSGNNATQPSSGVRPQIVSSGVVVVDTNGSPAMDFTGTQELKSASITAIAQPSTAISVVDTTGRTAQAGWFYTLGLTAYASILDDGSTMRMYAGSFVIGTSGTNTRRLDFSLFDGANSEIWFNGSSILTGNAGTNGISGIRIGGFNGPSFKGYFSEFIAYPSDQDAAGNRAGIQTNINDFYNIY